CCSLLLRAAAPICALFSADRSAEKIYANCPKSDNQGYLPYVASSSNCLIFNKIFTKPVYFNIVIYNKHLQNLLQKRKKTHNIMMNFLGTSAMIIQTILKA
ncbi:MAG TPA: hypothetical protein VJ943_14835, partial [Desulfotignum sp.]|nr:hypothetical protein [Desulfotignum sp.]